MHAEVFLETVEALRPAPACAFCLSEKFGISFSATHLRLGRLEDTGYVSGERGRCRRCRNERQVYRLSSRGRTLARALPKLQE